MPKRKTTKEFILQMQDINPNITILGEYINNKTLELFISLSDEVHNGKYKYDKVLYVKDDLKVIITCPIHRDFELIPLDYFGGILKLQHQRTRDEYVRNYCKDNDHRLIEIPYTMKEDDIMYTLNGIII